MAKATKKAAVKKAAPKKAGAKKAGAKTNKPAKQSEGRNESFAGIVGSEGSIPCVKG